MRVGKNRLVENPVKHYIGYKINNSVLVSLRIQKSKIVLSLNRVQPKDLRDPEKKLIYIEKSMEHYNKHITDFYVKKPEDIDYAMSLIRQVHNKFADEF